MNKIKLGRDYLAYKFKAQTAHDVHSPFVFELLNDVISDHTPYYGYELIESLRAKHLLDNRTITVNDFGAREGTRTEKISSIARISVKPKKYAQLLFRIANSFRCKNILEIGTSLGISTLYLSMSDTHNRVITLEGSPDIARLALKNFERLKRSNIELIEGEFSNTLPIALNKLASVDLVYFDGNHRKAPTLDYFHLCRKHSTENSIFIFDDIHWSREMNEAWVEIKSAPGVSTTIDLFQLGLVFFRKGMTKQDFVLRY